MVSDLEDDEETMKATRERDLSTQLFPPPFTSFLVADATLQLPQVLVQEMNVTHEERRKNLDRLCHHKSSKSNSNMLIERFE
jgi:hypothetical protein